MQATVTFLGPLWTTFTHAAYVELARRVNAPKVSLDRFIAARTNADVLDLAVRHGSYGAIAMATRAQGRVTESVESFMDLLARYAHSDDCPVTVLGALEMQLHISLMARRGMTKERIQIIVAHEKALGACRKNADSLGVRRNDCVSSNGEAARLVAKSDIYATAAALAPRAAAELYGLDVLDDAFEDRPAATMFYLIGPRSHVQRIGAMNRVLIVFRAPHKPGALLSVLEPLAAEEINMTEIHSAAHGEGGYRRFAIEFEVSEAEIPRAERALEEIGNRTNELIIFGPFEVVSG